MQVAQSKTREQFPLSNRKIIKKTIESNLAITILLTAVLLFGFWFVTLDTVSRDVIEPWLKTATFGVAVLLFVKILLTYFYERWYFAVYFYDLTSDFIKIRKGPITPQEITLPYERIQDVYVDQDLLDRMFGLYDVHLSSATVSSGMEAHIDGVEKPAADGLRAVLLETVMQRISKNRNTNAPATHLAS